MNLTLRSHGIDLSDRLRRHIRRSVERALDRHQDRVKEVIVSLADENGPRGGVDKICQVTAQLRDGAAVRFQARNQSAYAAVRETARETGFRIAQHRARTRTVHREGGGHVIV